MKDCLIPFDHSLHTQKAGRLNMWYLTKEMSAGGLNAQLHVFSVHIYTSKTIIPGRGLFYTGRESGSNG